MKGGARAYLVRAAVLVLVWAVMNWMGWEEHVSVLSGGLPANAWAGVKGQAYVASWLVAVVAAPVYVIAAGAWVVLGWMEEAARS